MLVRSADEQVLTLFICTASQLSPEFGIQVDELAKHAVSVVPDADIRRIVRRHMEVKFLRPPVITVVVHRIDDFFQPGASSELIFDITGDFYHVHLALKRIRPVFMRMGKRR